VVAAGLLDKRITIQAPTVSRNALGEPTVAWNAFATVWAGVEPVQGREFWAQQQVQSDVTVRIRMRYLPGVTTAMRVAYGSRVLDIRSVIDPRERHTELQLMCSEGVTNG
jgi:SPP1 family predicted phage head-tail adaptor